MWICTFSICFGIGHTKNEAFEDWIENYTQEYPFTRGDVEESDCRFFKIAKTSENEAHEYINRYSE